MSSMNRWTTGIALAVLLAGTASGCDNFLDVNEDPNNPVSVDMEYTLPAMLMSHTDVMSGTQANWTAQWMQQYAYNRDQYGYSQRHRYEMTSIDAEYPFRNPYVNTGREAVNMMNATEETEEWQYHGMAKLMLAWSGSMVTDGWGPIPWSEAFKTQVPDPVYDAQEDVYASLHQMIGEAITEMERTPAEADRVPGANDLLYDGDMDQWVKLARMLQARLHLRLAYAPGENPGQRAQAALDALAEGFTSNADNAMMVYPGGEGARQPRYWMGNGGWQESTVASEFFVTLLDDLADPRLPIMVEPALSDGVIRGHPNATPREPDSTISKLGEVIVGEAQPFPWFTYAEGQFIEAEARLITTGAGAADAPYREGIRANMERLGVAEADIDTYLASLPDLSSVAQPLEAIITQKYIANFLSPEVWNDWRRTGYPALTPVSDEYLPGIPTRLRTPAQEIELNADNVLNTGISQGLDGMLHDVWWASGSPTVQ